MYEEIKKKMVCLANMKNLDRPVKIQIRRLEIVDFVSTMLRLDGSVLTRKEVEAIIDGEKVPRSTINEHMMVERLIDALNTMDDFLEMKDELSVKVIEDLHDIITGGEEGSWRHSNVPAYTFDYMPPDFSEIKDRMKKLYIELYSEEGKKYDPILKAALMHCNLISIYPFRHSTETTARAAMYYYLKTQGIPVFDLRVTEQEYNTAVMDFLKKGDIRGFYNMLVRNVYNKLEVLSQLINSEMDG